MTLTTLPAWMDRYVHKKEINAAVRTALRTQGIKATVANAGNDIRGADESRLAAVMATDAYRSALQTALGLRPGAVVLGCGHTVTVPVRDASTELIAAWARRERCPSCDADLREARRREQEVRDADYRRRRSRVPPEGMTPGSTTVRAWFAAHRPDADISATRLQWLDTVVYAWRNDGDGVEFVAGPRGGSLFTLRPQRGGGWEWAGGGMLITTAPTGQSVEATLHEYEIVYVPV